MIRYYNRAWLGLLLAATSCLAGFIAKERHWNHQYVSSQVSSSILDENDMEPVTKNETVCVADTACQAVDNNDNAIISEASYQATSPAMRAVDEFGSDLGVKQLIDAVHTTAVKNRIIQARAYVSTIVQVDPAYEQVRPICQNQHESCAFWAVLGECDKNPAYMHIHCAPVCHSCDLLDIEKRCPRDPNAINALPHAGDLDRRFETILTSPEYAMYQPRALSRPTLAPGDSLETADYVVGGPWLVVLETAATPDEAQRLRDLGAAQGYQRSEDVGVKRADGTYTSQSNAGRTSTNAWCVGECYTDPVAQQVMQRIAHITGIPETNSENLQLLRYEQGQFYQTHNDYIPYQKERQAGVRILTFYLYLNDVAEGGGTNFPRIGNLTVTPKQGRAVLWPSVLNSDPHAKDDRSDHQALPVLQGVKYGANAWIHQRDFKGPSARGCS